MTIKKVVFPLNGKNKKEIYFFFLANTKNISSHVLKISAVQLVLRTREITDIFSTFDEIYFPLKKVNILYLFSEVISVLQMLLNVASEAT